MPDFEKMYFHMAGQIAEAIKLLSRAQTAEAFNLLIKAQQEGEDAYIGEMSFAESVAADIQHHGA